MTSMTKIIAILYLISLKNAIACECNLLENAIKLGMSRGQINSFAGPDGGPDLLFLQERYVWRQNATCAINITFEPTIGFVEAIEHSGHNKDPRRNSDLIVNVSKSYCK